MNAGSLWRPSRWRMDETRALGITIEIVTRPAEQFGFQVQPRRPLVERTIAWINRCWRLSKDFEHHAGEQTTGGNVTTPPRRGCGEASA
jgi:transposase